jgi:hypothetical protein
VAEVEGKLNKWRQSLKKLTLGGGDDLAAIESNFSEKEPNGESRRSKQARVLPQIFFNIIINEIILLLIIIKFFKF